MFDVIDALEVLGADADLAGASSVRVDAMLQAAGAEPALRSALLEGDAGTLETLLRVPKYICIFIHPAEEEEEPEDEEEDDEEGEEDGDDEEDGADSRKKPKPRGS
ncbi:MAG: hypothetical protein ACYDAE_14965 [Steroidobacteraceae bacterium]